MLRNSAQAQGALPALAFDRVNRLVCHRSRMTINFQIAPIETTYLCSKEDYQLTSISMPYQ
jgi:hypothetical protein